jgi:class 3 adenylate cyclase
VSSRSCEAATTREPGKKFWFFRLKVSFLSVLALIQVLLIGLSFLFGSIIVESMEHSDQTKFEALARFVENETKHGASRVTLAVLSVAENHEMAKAFHERDRAKLLALSSGLWNKLQPHGLETFEFSAPSPRGMISFLRVNAPNEYGENNSGFRPMLVKCDETRSPVKGLEQDRTGYAFREAAPVFYRGEYAGCVEFGSRLDTGFLKRLNEVHAGSWSIVNLERGVDIHGGDKLIVGALNITGETASSEAQLVPASTLADIRAGQHTRVMDPVHERVSMYVPVKNFRDDVALYLRHDYDTHYWRRIRSTIWTSVGICLLGLILSSLVIWVLYREITTPIDALVLETEKIRGFDLDGPPPRDARLREIQKLVSAITSMKVGLRAFKKYVPAQLVRQLMETGEEAHINGQRRELTLLFSDIADFTSIAEHLRPRELTAQLSEYFEAATQIIMDEKGTVDKFIGDAVMAFWGAPLPLQGHALHACRAALRLQRRIGELNGRWIAQGKPVFHTRIGLNSGEVIVGNMGSEQRLNYTAVGDPVNLASRLEGINKSYKTRIILSQHTFELCKSGIEARILDFATVKGKAEVLTLYELLAEKGDISSADQEFARRFTNAVLLYREKDWDRAIEQFQRLARERPDDFPTILFLRRCHSYKANPPPADWSGVAA